MSAKLTATHFRYRHSERDGWTDGSYLGRKRASATTIRRFIASNRRACRLPVGRTTAVEVTACYLSPWRYFP